MTQLRFEFAEGDEGLLVQRLREGTGKGLAVVAIAKQIGVSPAKAIIAARRAGIRYKHQHAPASQIRAAIRAVRREGRTIREAAREFGISKSALQRFVYKRRQKALDAAGEFKFETASPENRKSWRCPKHGRLTVWPCVACAAESIKYTA